MAPRRVKLFEATLSKDSAAPVVIARRLVEYGKSSGVLMELFPELGQT